jgi:flagellar basal body-associated protein FliL
MSSETPAPQPSRFARLSALMKSPRVAAMMQSPRRRMLVLGALAVAAAGVSGGIGFFVLLATGAFSDPAEQASHASASKAAGGASGAAGAHGAAPGAEGEAPPGNGLLDLGPFTVNLRGSNGARVLRLQLWVQPVDEYAADAGAAVAQLRSVTVMLVGDYSYHDLEGTEGKVRLRDELLAKMNQTLGRHVIERIYFTEFVVQ